MTASKPHRRQPAIKNVNTSGYTLRTVAADDPRSNPAEARFYAAGSKGSGDLGILTVNVNNGSVTSTMTPESAAAPTKSRHRRK